MLREFFSREKLTSLFHGVSVSPTARRLTVPFIGEPMFTRPTPPSPSPSPRERLSFRTGSERERKVLSAISQHHRSRGIEGTTVRTAFYRTQASFVPERYFPRVFQGSSFFSFFLSSPSLSPPSPNEILGTIELVNVRGNASLSTLVPELSWLRFKMLTRFVLRIGPALLPPPHSYRAECEVLSQAECITRIKTRIYEALSSRHLTFYCV